MERRGQNMNLWRYGGLAQGAAIAGAGGAAPGKAAKIFGHRTDGNAENDSELKVTTSTNSS